MKNKETLEEVAIRLLPDRNGFTNRDRFNFIEGAVYREIEINALKIKQERSYSEEDMRKAIQETITLMRYKATEFREHENTVIEQFKKK